MGRISRKYARTDSYIRSGIEPKNSERNDLEIQNRVKNLGKKINCPSFLQHKQGDYESDFADDNSYNSGTQGGDEPDVQDKSGNGLPEENIHTTERKK